MQKEGENLALYRKYRPSDFSEVLGQEHIVKVLEKSVTDKAPAHAYLFVGSRGTGKTTFARIFANALDVSQNDVIEIDAASNRGIDDVRELRDGVRILPFDSKYKVYILDEVHMFTKEAWNTLLKTLEEPPKHVIFILATTELQKVPDTIISRCQVFNFKKPTEHTLVELVHSVAKKEKFSIDDEGAELVAILGDGSFRDTLGTLQKVLSFAKSKKITLADIEEITGAPKNVLVNDLLTAICEKNLENALKIVAKASSQNLEMRLFLKLVIQKLRHAVLLKYAPKLEGEEVNISGADQAFLKDLIKKDTHNLLRSSTLAKVLEAYSNQHLSFISELPLEMALVELLGEK